MTVPAVSGICRIVAASCLLVSFAAVSSCRDSGSGAGRKPSELVEAGSWNTVEWPVTRGGGGLQGVVNDKLPDRPGVRWAFPAGSAVTSEAAVGGGLVVFGCEDGTIHAVDVATGKGRWVVATRDTVEATPAICGGRVFVGSNDRMFRALDLARGRELWKLKGEEKFPTGAVVVESPPGGLVRILVNGYDGVTRCLDTASGEEVWRHETEDFINGSPAMFAADVVVSGGCDAMVRGLSLADGKERFCHKAGAQVVRSVASCDGVIYSVNHANQLQAVDAAAGKTLWTVENGDSPFLTSPAVDSNAVYAGSRDKCLHAIDRKTGTLLWKFRTGGRVESSALVLDGAVVFGSADGRLYAVDKRSGSEIWRVDLGESLTNAPAFANGCFVIGGSGGTMFIVGRKGGG